MDATSAPLADTRSGGVQYVNHTHGICEDADDSAEVFYKHHNFLLSRMLKGEEGVQWTGTSVFGHLCEKFPVRSVPFCPL